jgi:hypothetical protein
VLLGELLADEHDVDDAVLLAVEADRLRIADALEALRLELGDEGLQRADRVDTAGLQRRDLIGERDRDELDLARVAAVLRDGLLDGDLPVALQRVDRDALARELLSPRPGRS